LSVLHRWGVSFRHTGTRLSPWLQSQSGTSIATSAKLGTPCDLTWREGDERERLWVTDPGHQIVDGLGDSIVIEETETYGEPFGVPEPDRLVFTSWFDGGEVFRSGCCYRRGRGKLFYFRPGHETYPIYHREDIQQVLDNAVHWATPTTGSDAHADNRNVDAPESQ